MLKLTGNGLPQTFTPAPWLNGDTQKFLYTVKL